MVVVVVVTLMVVGLFRLRFALLRSPAIAGWNEAGTRSVSATTRGERGGEKDDKQHRCIFAVRPAFFGVRYGGVVSLCVTAANGRGVFLCNRLPSSPIIALSAEHGSSLPPFRLVWGVGGWVDDSAGY